MARPDRPRSVYLDACLYIDWAEGTYSVAEVETWLHAARANKVRVVASTLLFAEARGIKNKNGKRDLSGEQKLRALLQEPYVTLVDVTRRIGILARDITMDLPVIKNMDAVHLATAAYSEANVLLTRDADHFPVGQTYRGVWVDKPYEYGGEGLFPLSSS